MYWRTAYPTITWWDSSNYSLAAATLGITSSPGSLLLTLLGWPVTRLPLGLKPAHQLNLLAGLLAAITVGLVFVIALRVLRIVDGPKQVPGPATVIGAALGALSFAFSATLWEHAVKFTPYVLSVVFTALILLTMLRWWEDAERPDAWRWLMLLGILFGLDFSVHRTNALLMPAVLAWILVRHPRALRRPDTWLGGTAGLVAGLAVQLLVIPIAINTRSPLNMWEPTNWARFWEYVSLAQVGGGFLVELWPRNSGFWTVQLADFLRVTGESFFHSATPLRLLGLLPGLAAIGGFGLVVRRHRRLGMALVLVVLLHATMTVLYFNIPAEYFRTFDRHYLPVFVTIGVALACGSGAFARVVARSMAFRAWIMAAGGAALVALPAVAQLVGNWNRSDASNRYFTRDVASNALETLPPNAVYFTVGDNDTFPVMYLQAVEGVRPDVAIVNLSLANTSWYIDQIKRRHPWFPTSRADTVRRASGAKISLDTAVVVPVRSTAQALGLTAETIVPSAITVRPQPMFGKDVLPADVVLVDVVRTNEWRHPLSVAITAGPEGTGWLAPFRRLEGLHWRIVPAATAPPDRELLRTNLLERHEYRGYADRSVRLDDVSRNMGMLYFTPARALLEAERAAGATDRCRDTKTALFAKLPPDRLAMPASDRAELEALCRGG